MEKQATTYNSLADVPDDVYELYSMEGPTRPIYGDLEWGILCLRNNISVTAYFRHHKRGWEAK